MSAIEELTELHENIEEAWEALSARSPDLAKSLREMLEDAPKAAEAAKRELRTLGAGSHTFGDGLTFRVTPGPTKIVFDAEDVVMEAEDGGHVDTLLATGFLKYSVDAKQLERLPADLRAIYSGLGATKVGTARVSLPKNLCK
jgi:hypothetical protein